LRRLPALLIGEKAPVHRPSATGRGPLMRPGRQEGRAQDHLGAAEPKLFVSRTGG
jgi:hypothetical protein